VQPLQPQLGPQRDDGLGKARDDAAFGRQHLVALGLGQEAHVLGQHAVLVLRAGVGGHEAADQRAQPRLGVQPRRQAIEQRLQPRHVAAGDVQQQALLVGEVVVQRRLADAAGRGHLVHRGRRVALAREQLGGTRADLLALVVVAGGARSGHGGRLSGGRTRPPPARSAGAPGR